MTSLQMSILIGLTPDYEFSLALLHQHHGRFTNAVVIAGHRVIVSPGSQGNQNISRPGDGSLISQSSISPDSQHLPATRPAHSAQHTLDLHDCFILGVIHSRPGIVGHTPSTAMYFRIPGISLHEPMVYRVTPAGPAMARPGSTTTRGVFNPFSRLFLYSCHNRLSPFFWRASSSPHSSIYRTPPRFNSGSSKPVLSLISAIKSIIVPAAWAYDSISKIWEPI